MSKRKEGIAGASHSALALIACILYTLITVLFIIRHSLTLKLFLLFGITMVGMLLVVAAMWVGYISSRSGRVGEASATLGKIGFLIKMISGVALITANFVVVIVGFVKLNSAIKKKRRL